MAFKIHSAPFLIMLIAMVAFTACTKYIEFEGENAQPRLVLNGLLQQDSLIEVRMSNSLGFIDPGNTKPLTTATVLMTIANGQAVDTLQHIGEGRYLADFAAQTGEAYTLRASAGSFSEVIASDVVPNMVPIAAWDTLRSSNSSNSFDETTFTIFFTLNDPAAIENFYLLEVLRGQQYFLNPIFDISGNFLGYDTIYDSSNQGFTTCFSTSDPILMSENDVFAGDLELFSCALLFSDRLFNGSTRQFSVKLDYFNSFSADELELRLSSVSRDYFRYLRTLQRYDWVEGDPFAEPVQVFSNVEGGLGILGARSFDSVFISF